MKTCFFIGHRNAPSNLQERLNAEVERLVKLCDVTEFIVGYHGDFDQMATAAVQRIKKQFPEIYAYRLLSYFPDEYSPPVPEFFDDIFYPEGMETVPKRFSIERANRKVLMEANYLIAFVCRDWGNSAKLLRNARSLEKKGVLQVINLAEGIEWW